MKEQPLIRHSYSSTSNYQTCPRRYRDENYLKKYVSESGPAAERGTEMHDWLEECINEERDYPDPDYQWLLDDFRSQNGLKIAEMQLSIDRDWNPVAYDDPSAWYRGKLDMTCIDGAKANLSDLKTGKRKFKRPDPFETWLLRRHETGMHEAPRMLANARQASEYTLLLLLHFPQVMEVDFRFVWSEKPDGVKEDLFRFERERDADKLLQTMLATPVQIEASAAEGTWEPNPSGLCRAWCPCVDCEFHGKAMSEIRRM